MYFATPAEWVRHVQNHTETELALSNSNASLRQTNVNNTTSNVPSHRSSRPQTHHIESTKYSHTQTNSHRLVIAMNPIRIECPIHLNQIDADNHINVFR